MAVIRYMVAYEYNELCIYNLTVHGPVQVGQTLDLDTSIFQKFFYEFKLKFSYLFLIYFF
jgi:hypothetical protein